jgi:myo-inositol-1-phosphate synthase
MDRIFSKEAAANTNGAADSTKGVEYDSAQELDEDGVIALTVPSKYTGTATDKKDMQTLGKVQVLRVSGTDRACYG